MFNQQTQMFFLFFIITLLSICDIFAWNDSSLEQEQSLRLAPNLNNGIKVYEVCSACHMPEGWGVPDGTYPQISGQHQNVLIKQLTDIRQLNRDNPSMYPFALPEEIGGSQAIADVTAYIEKLPMLNENGIGSGKNLELGKKLYHKHCSECHGKNGEGNNEKFYPRIHGQHYNYLVRQFEWIQSGKRRNANPEMIKQIKNFSQNDTEAVLDYVSRLLTPKEKTVDKNWRNPDFD
ncbi:MAG: c-type cytochrome [gamma proteobacterium symbiont of Taylorina sp.]|nr:c-type cytochrome [gamma proteobacterium symbiont of Taylorina sp.]